MARILIVDDSPNARKLLLCILESEGHVVLEFADGAEALAAAARENPDLVITDACMPGMSGPQFVAGLRKVTQTMNTPVIFHSASGDEHEIRKTATAHGVASILIKPCPAEVLLAEIAAALNAPLHEPFRGIPERRQAKIPAYLAGCDTDVVTLGSALAAGDLATIQAVGHNLKGTGSAYGFYHITRIGDRLESAAKAGERRAISEEVTLLSRYLGTLKARLAETADRSQTGAAGKSPQCGTGPNAG